MNERRLPWDDLRTLLAIARTGSLSGAMRELGVSHATVFRRLGGIERRLGVKLFERSRSGYVPTASGEDIARVAECIEAEVLDVERRIAGRDLKPSGTVRVTTTDSLLSGLLSPMFADFRAEYPEISLEIAVSNHLFSLSKREADVAIRPTRSPPEMLVGRKIGSVAQAVYGRSDRYAGSGDGMDFDAVDWVGPDEGWAYEPLQAWMAVNGFDARCRYRVDNLMGVLAAVREGIGLAILPCYLGDADRRLIRLGDTIPELSTDLWLLTHPDLRGTARVRKLMDHVARSARDARDSLSGVG